MHYWLHVFLPVSSDFFQFFPVSSGRNWKKYLFSSFFHSSWKKPISSGSFQTLYVDKDLPSWRCKPTQNASQQILNFRVSFVFLLFLLFIFFYYFLWYFFSFPPKSWNSSPKWKNYFPAFEVNNRRIDATDPCRTVWKIQRNGPYRFRPCTFNTFWHKTHNPYMLMDISCIIFGLCTKFPARKCILRIW